MSALPKVTKKHYDTEDFKEFLKLFNGADHLFGPRPKQGGGQGRGKHAEK